MAEQLTSDELEELITEGERPADPPPSTPYQTVPIPCTIYKIPVSRDATEAEEINSSGEWQYAHNGVFIPDSFTNDPDVKRDILIPYERIDAIEFHFPEEEEKGGE